MPGYPAARDQAPRDEVKNQCNMGFAHEPGVSACSAQCKQGFRVYFFSLLNFGFWRSGLKVFGVCSWDLSLKLCKFFSEYFAEYFIEYVIKKTSTEITPRRDTANHETVEERHWHWLQ